LGSLLQLRNLNLSYSSYVEGRLNIKALVALTKLECLNLSSKRSSIGNLPLPEVFSRLTNLKYLNLSGSLCSVVDHDIIQALGSLTKLQSLNLSRCEISVRADSHLSGMSEAMRNLTELRYLNLSQCSTTAVLSVAEGLYIFLECISNLPNLEHLDLSFNAKFTRVPDCICSLRKLQILDLAYCEDLQSLPAALPEMDNLKFLNLENCSGLELLNVPTLNKHLITLPHFLVQADYHDSSTWSFFNV